MDGHEETETLDSLRKRFEQETKFLQELKDMWQDLNHDEKLDKIIHVISPYFGGISLYFANFTENLPI